MPAPTGDERARDEHLMAVALAMAARGLGRTAPNPAVGCVIADPVTGEVIARGTTAPGGRPHAEVVALERAGDRARGATMYVTLEPCSHFGKTPPCADAIVAAGIARVVVAITDPDPRVAGRGLARLQAAGIAVTKGIGAARAHWITRGHIVRVTERRPFVQLKLALDETGEVARGAAGRPVWVTGPAARARGHLLRARADAILVGAGTVRADDPELTCRLPGLHDRSPVRVVLDARLDIAPFSRLVATAAAHPLLIVTSADALAARGAALALPGVEIVAAAVVGGRLWLPAVLEALAARGVTRLLVEGGPRTWAAFAETGFVDEVVLFHAAADRVGDAAMREALVRHVPLAGLEPVEVARLGADRMIVMRRAHAAPGGSRLCLADEPVDR